MFTVNRRKKAEKYLLSNYIIVFKILAIRAACRGKFVSRKNLQTGKSVSIRFKWRLNEHRY